MQGDPQLLRLWQRLLLRPDVSLAAGGTLRGLLLLRVAHTLMDALQSSSLSVAQLDVVAATTALLQLLEVSDSIGRCAPSG